MAPSQRQARRLAALVVAAAALAPGAASACNPFEFLFGNCRETVGRPEAAPELSAPVVAAPRKKRAFANSGGVSAKQIAIAPPPGSPVGSIAHFAEDKTLRRGDVVVTPEGFLVYRGGDRRHVAEDFQPLGKTRGDLASLVNASRNERSSYAPIVTPLAPSGSHRQATVVAAPGARDFQATAE